MAKRKCVKCGKPSIPGLTFGLCQYHYDVHQFGQKWADRCAMETKPPADQVKERGCECCAGYGQPGWIVNAHQWIRCPQCNQAEGDHST